MIEVLPPDAKAVEKLLRFYGAEAIDADTDLSAAAAQLDGSIPAVIAEVVKRAKLSQLKMQPKGVKVTKLSAEALLEASTTMSKQLELLYPKEVEAEPTVDFMLRRLVKSVVDGGEDGLDKTKSRVKELHAQVVGE